MLKKLGILFLAVLFLVPFIPHGSAQQATVNPTTCFKNLYYGTNDCFTSNVYSSGSGVYLGLAELNINQPQDHWNFTSAQTTSQSNPTQTFGLANQGCNTTNISIGSGTVSETGTSSSTTYCYSYFFPLSSTPVLSVYIVYGSNTILIPQTSYLGSISSFNSYIGPNVFQNASFTEVKWLASSYNVTFNYNGQVTTTTTTQAQGGSTGSQTGTQPTTSQTNLTINTTPNPAEQVGVPLIVTILLIVFGLAFYTQKPAKRKSNTENLSNLIRERERRRKKGPN